eukprot:GHRR01005399.1.p1 GENE.GHRR01005399.1~~GHRR01005399.1.p1  ORF type:complete len:454 (+),score=149.12 GHRR01005399.1:1151-2512(+)
MAVTRALLQVAAFGIGRGPLALPDCPWLDNLAKFGAVLSMPIIPRQVFKISKGSNPNAISTSAPTTPAQFLYSYGCKTGGATIASTLAVWPVLPELMRHWFYALSLSLSLGAIWDFWCLSAVMFFGLDIAPSFDKPWLSSSFADYWSRRWNLTTTYMLRVLIYEPVMEGRFVPISSTASIHKSAATAATATTVGDADVLKAQTEQTEKPQIKITATAAPAPAGPEDESDAEQSPRDSSSHSHSSICSCDSSNDAKQLADQEQEDLCSKDVSGLFSDSKIVRSEDVKGGLRRQCAAVCTASNSGSSASLTGIAAASQSGKDVTQQQQREQQATAGAAVPNAKRPNRLLRRIAALQATFAFSGLWHALIFYYATGLVTYHWFTFFTVQAPIMAVEAILIKWAQSRGLLLPKPVAIFLTNFLLIVVANPLFFGPCDWSGMCTAMMNNVKEMFGFAQ